MNHLNFLRNFLDLCWRQLWKLNFVSFSRSLWILGFIIQCGTEQSAVRKTIQRESDICPTTRQESFLIANSHEVWTRPTVCTDRKFLFFSYVLFRESLISLLRNVARDERTFPNREELGSFYEFPSLPRNWNYTKLSVGYPKISPSNPGTRFCRTAILSYSTESWNYFSLARFITPTVGTTAESPETILRYLRTGITMLLGHIHWWDGITW